MSRSTANRTHNPAYRLIDDCVASITSDIDATIETPAKWVQLLNSLPMIPLGFDSEVENLAHQVRMQFEDVERVEVHVMPAGRPRSKGAQTEQLARRQRRDSKRQLSVDRYQWFESRHPAVVAEVKIDHSVTILCQDDEGDTMAELALYPRAGRSVSQLTTAQLPAIARFIAYALGDLRARCSFFEDRALPNLDELSEIISTTVRLTLQDKRVLRLVLGGASYVEAAHALGLSHESVKKHLKRIYERTNTMGLSSLFGRFAAFASVACRNGSRSSNPADPHDDAI